ncbi:TonB-dependent receptor [Govanella unica]|uniref:TonB-dependent receptor n=1 Tax=Govanella unica TaxID=2975056 RepID=A0A9X3Z770_9PROT|nr:TonB-dependent receptor [Govania unica]MDA5193861.1 TonB-dependent receptor [Govania unica]
MLRGLLGTTAFLALVPFFGEAAAQDQRADRLQIEEITVVAQRREQSILDVPVSVTLFSAESIEKQNIQSAKDYLQQTPNVSYQVGGRNGSREIVIAIRGISDIKNAEKIDTSSAFSTYVDEFSQGTLASGQANPPTYDIERIEVLRGPQGTFFGRNSEGGAINIMTKKPSKDLYGQVDFGGGRFNSYELAGVANVPVTDTLFTRLTVQSAKSDGPMKNLHPTGGNSGNEYLSLRGQVRWLPTTNTTIDMQIGYIVDNQDYTPKAATCVKPRFGANPFDGKVLGDIGCYDPQGELLRRINLPAGNPDRVVLPAGMTYDSLNKNRLNLYQNTRERTENRTTTMIGRINHEFEDFSITSISGLAKSDQTQFMDLDHSGVDGIDRFGLFDATNWSQEVRLQSVGKKTIDWTVGGIYYKDKFQATNQILIKHFLAAWMNGDTANQNVIHSDRDGWAGFANLEWHITEPLSLIVGGRFSHDNSSSEWTDVYAACGKVPYGSPLAPGCALRPDQLDRLVLASDGTTVYQSGGRKAQTAGAGYQSTSGKDFSPRIALNYKPNDNSSYYVTVSKGYKPNGVRLNPDSGFDHTSRFKKEQLWNYEAGFNAALFDRRMTVSGAIFLMDWKDMQVLVSEEYCNVGGVLIPIDGPSAPVGNTCLRVPLYSIQNAKKARSKGFELSAQGMITNGWQVGGSVGYLNAKFVDFLANVAGTTADVSGQPIGSAPKWTLSANTQYNFPLAGGEAFARASWSYRSASSLDIARRVNNQYPSNIPAFGLVNLAFGQTWGRVNLALNIENLLDSKYYTAAESFSYAGVMLDVHPRTWFLKATWKTN